MFTTYKRLFSYIPEQKMWAYLAIVISSLSSLSLVAALYYIYQFLQKIIFFQDFRSGSFYALIVATLMVTSSITYVLSGLVSHKVAFRLETNLRKKGIDGLMSSNFAFFDDSASGKVRKIIDDNAAETHSIVAHLIPDNAGAITAPLAILILSFLINPIIALILIFLIGISAILIKKLVGDTNLMFHYSEALENLNGATVEYVRGMQVIKLFKTSIQSFKALHQAIQNYSKIALKYAFSCRSAYVWFQVLFASYILVLITFFVFFFPVEQQKYYLAQFLFLFSVIGLIFSSFMRVMYVSMYWHKAKNVIDKIENLYEEMTSNKVYQGENRELSDSSIEFRDVSFGYEKDLPIIQHLSFSLKPNKVYALVGSSGSGKTTIAKLIAGFYKADSGQVLLGGKPIESYSQEGIMTELAFVFQVSRLFKISIFENVQMGNPKASYEEVMKALELACCQDILDKFPQREQTVIGASGVHLSGGEMQRLAIARAILKDAKIIILDEASASTDVVNEYQIQQAFSNLIENKTVLIIAHRLSSIRGVDEILLIKQGSIIARGSDEALSQESTEYQHLKKLYASANEWRVS
ncbi:MAG: ABC transporter ATP-binding protein [Streptococcus sp.]|nr:ABC transporter ATP-binding protein [Streptococcus sp.]